LVKEIGRKYQIKKEVHRMNIQVNMLMTKSVDLESLNGQVGIHTREIIRTTKEMVMGK
jgi:hypothetical protein